MTTTFALIGLLVVLTGCSATGPSFQDSPFATQPVADDKSRIIFYRQSDANFRSATIGIDGSIVGAVAHNGFVVAEVAPGDRKISAWVRGFPFHEFVIDMPVKGGETYYIRVSHRAERMIYPFFGLIGGIVYFADTKGEFQLLPVSAAIALLELKELKHSE